MAQLNMNLENVETQEALEPLPPGEYLARIVDSEIKEARSGITYIKFTWEVLDEKHRGRKLFENVSITNPHGKRYDAGKSPAEIGQRKLKTIATCGGHPNPNFLRDTEELHGLPMLVRVKLRNDPEYGPQNDVAGHKQARSAAGPGPANVQAPAQAQAQASAPEPKSEPDENAVPAWMKPQQDPAPF